MKQIEQANNCALERLLSATPVLVDVVPAQEIITNLKDLSEGDLLVLPYDGGNEAII